MAKSLPKRAVLAAIAFWAGAGAGCSAPRSTAAPAPVVEQVKVVEVAGGLEFPWSLAFLPDGRMLVTERPGRLRFVSRDGQISAPIGGGPAVAAQSQGGLLDVLLAPDFAQSGVLYLSYSEAGAGGAGTAVARARLSGAQLSDLKVIFRQEPKVKGGNHYGSRLVWSRDGALFVTLGERFDHRDQAQDLGSLLGKVVRIRPEGGAAAGNPFAGRQGARAEIWSYGHRNVQGAALHPATGVLWTHEHGARGGDEVNITRAGLNYGWPLVSFGVNYSGLPVGTGKSTGPGIQAPLLHWTPSIAPSGMAFYTGDRFPGWKGDLFVGALAGQHLVRIDLEGERVLGQERLLEDQGARIRDVRQGPDGFVYVLTDDEDGRLLRLEPAS